MACGMASRHRYCKLNTRNQVHFLHPQRMLKEGDALLLSRVRNFWHSRRQRRRHIWQQRPGNAGGNSHHTQKIQFKIIWQVADF